MATVKDVLNITAKQEQALHRIKTALDNAVLEGLGPEHIAFALENSYPGTTTELAFAFEDWKRKIGAEPPPKPKKAKEPKTRDKRAADREAVRQAIARDLRDRTVPAQRFLAATPVEVRKVGFGPLPTRQPSLPEAAVEKRKVGW